MSYKIGQKIEIKKPQTTLESTFNDILSVLRSPKMKEADKSIENTKAQIELAEQDNQKVLSQTDNYVKLIDNLKEINERITDANRTRKVIPNLLNQIMFNIPEGVQITSIQNTTGNKIEIQAQSNQYEQLGFFKAILQNEHILLNVISTPGQKEGDIVKVKIEGEIP